MFKPSLQDYYTIKTNIIRQLELSGNAVGNIREELGKTDFDHIDILIKLTSKNPLELISYFKPIKTICTSSAFSFDYSLHGIYSPIKINLIDTRNIPMSEFYYSDGKIGTILSKICTSIGLTLGESGLRIKLVKNAEDKFVLIGNGHIFLSDMPEKICIFLGLKYNAWKIGFTNNRDIFRWIMKCKYFSSDMFLKMGLNKRKRSKKNGFYNDFLDYVQKKCGGSASQDKIETDKNLQRQAIEHFGLDDPKDDGGK